MILAVDMGGTRWKAAVMDRGEVLAFDALPNNNVIADLDDLAGLFNRLLADVGASLDECTGLGISLAEIVDSTTKTSPSPCYKHPYLTGKNVEVVVRDYIDMPVFVDNDARAALIGEETYGALRGIETDNALTITLGTGIGVGVRVNGVMLTGAHATASTLGAHITIDLNGPDCVCGNRGCAEALGSGWVLRDRVPLRDGYSGSAMSGIDRPGFKHLTDAVRKGDSFATTVLTEFTAAWTSLLVSLIHVYDPTHIVLTGGFTYAADLFVDSMVAPVAGRIWDSHNMPQVLVSDQPENSGLRGCEVMVRQGLGRAGSLQ